MDSSHPTQQQTETRLITSGRDTKAQKGFVNPPVFHGSTVLYPTAEDLHAHRGEFTYGRHGSPTTKAFQETLMALEGPQCAGVGIVPSGLSAISTTLLSVLCAGSILLAALLAWRISLSITRPLQDAREVAHKIANMDLSGNVIQVHSGDETGELLQALSSMRTALETTLLDVRQVADHIATATGEIASGNADLSHRTEDTATHLQSTASAMEQLSATVHQSADAASTANQLASTAASVAARGGEVVSKVVLPFTKTGVVGGVMLGLGRALGETMAVTFVIGNMNQLNSLSVF